MQISKSQLLLIIGLSVVLAGAVMSFIETTKGYADYFLVAGALLVILRGSLKMRDK